MRHRLQLADNKQDSSGPFDGIKKQGRILAVSLFLSHFNLNYRAIRPLPSKIKRENGAFAPLGLEA
jgi:hypothetical protein